MAAAVRVGHVHLECSVFQDSVHRLVRLNAAAGYAVTMGAVDRAVLVREISFVTMGYAKYANQTVKTEFAEATDAAVFVETALEIVFATNLREAVCHTE